MFARLDLEAAFVSSELKLCDNAAHQINKAPKSPNKMLQRLLRPSVTFVALLVARDLI